MELNNLKIGQEIYYVDASESGDIRYTHGIIVEKIGERVTLEVRDSGSFFSVGFIPSLSGPAYTPGDKITLRKNPSFLILSPEEFKQYRRSVESLPSLSDIPLPQEREEESAGEVGVIPALDPGEEVSPEEGSPDYEIDDDEEGLHLKAKIQVVAESLDDVNIIWPKGFPEPWMNDVFNALEKTNIGIGPGGEPAVASPGGKGLVPRESLALQKKVESLGQEQKELINAVNKLQEQLDTAEADLVVLKDKNESPENISSKQKEVESLRSAVSEKNKTLSDVTQRRKLAQEEYTKSLMRHPEEATYSKVPGGHRSRDLASGRVALTNELKAESEKYKKTLEDFEQLKKLQKTYNDSAKELDLILGIRKKKLVDRNRGLSAEPEWTLETDPYAHRHEGEALKELTDLKFQFIKNLPYFWDRKEYQSDFPLKEIEADSGASRLFESKMGKADRAFYDLIPEELELMARQWAAAHPVEETLSEKQVADRAHDFAEDYRKHIIKEIHFKDIIKPLQDYIADRYDLAISDKTAKEIDRLLTTRPAVLTITGRNINTGKEEKVKIPSEELRVNVKKPLSQPFENRVMWLRSIQDGRKKAIEERKEKLRRDLSVLQNTSLEKLLENSTSELTNLVAGSYNFTNTWHKTQLKGRDDLLASPDADRLKKLIEKYSKKLSEIKSNKDFKDFIDEEKMEAAETSIEAALKAFDAEDFSKVASEIESFKQSFEDLYITPPLDKDSYKTTIFEIFRKYRKAIDLQVPSKDISRYRQEYPSKMYDEKEKVLKELIKKEKDLEKQVKELDGEKDKLYTPYKEAVEAFEKFRVELGGTVANADVSQEVARISTQLKELLKEVGLYTSGKKEVDVPAVFEKIKQLKAKRIELLRQGISKDLWPRVDEKESELEKLYIEYESATKQLFERQETLRDQLDQLRKEKFTLMDELELTEKEIAK